MTVLFNCAQRMETISDISEKPEYAGHTVNFRTHVKSYKNKKRVDNPKEGGCCHNCAVSIAANYLVIFTDLAGSFVFVFFIVVSLFGFGVSLCCDHIIPYRL